jgi:hypothetical protein
MSGDVENAGRAPYRTQPRDLIDICMHQMYPGLAGDAV